MIGQIESLPHSAGVVHVGKGSFVMPWREFRATPSQVARLEIAATVEGSPQLAGIGTMLLAEIEREMASEARRRAKTPPEGRAIRVGADLDISDGPLDLVPGRELGLPVVEKDGGLVYQPDPLRRPEPVRAAVMEKFDKVEAAEPISAPIKLADLNDAQRRLLQQADDKLASAENRKAARRTALGHGRMSQAERDERRFAQRAYQQLGLGILARTQVLEVAEGFAETARLEAARGETIETASIDGQTVTRITSRDGLDSLGLDPIRHFAALWYRELFDRTERGAKIANMGGDVRGGSEHDRKASDWGLDQITRKNVEAKVMAESRNGRGITALRLVAGQGRTINSISGGKSQNRRLNTEALLLALDVVADFRGMQ